MLMQLLAGLVCLAAALLQFAVHRDPSIVDRSMRRTARRITAAALALAAVYALHAAYNGAAPSASFLILLLLGLSQAIFAVSDLWPHLEQEHAQWTSRLNSSP